MDSTDPSLLDSFKSRKVLRSSLKPNPSSSTEVTIRDQWSSKTPEKPPSAPRRSRNRNSALSLREVRQAAQNLRKSDPERSAQSDPLLTEQTALPARSKHPDGSTKLPEKYEMLVEFFNSLDSSIRLLRLKGSMVSFKNISPKIESLTDRRFTQSHLAQLKFILPEAIEIKKVLIHDERTNCMKPDLHITLNVSAIGNEGKTKSGIGNIDLRKEFRTRLLDFLKAHSEVEDIPGEELPEPFNQPKHENLRKASKLLDSPNEVVSEQKKHDAGFNLSKPPASASHLSQSFRRSFSRPNTLSREEQTKPDSLKSSYERTAFESSANSHFELCPNIQEGFILTAKGTPVKLASTPAKPMSSTPAIPPPKRCYMSHGDDSTKSPDKLVRRNSRARLIFDTPVKNSGSADQVSETGTCSAYDDILDVLPDSLLQSIREKERKALEEKDPAISQAKWRKQMIASLPKMFDMIYFLFQSIQRSVITKKELVHKIIASHIEIVDSREVEEQFRLLHELAPEWIYEKMALSGELLVCVNKIQSPVSIRARLADAK